MFLKTSSTRCRSCVGSDVDLDVDVNRWTLHSLLNSWRRRAAGQAEGAPTGASMVLRGDLC